MSSPYFRKQEVSFHSANNQSQEDNEKYTLNVLKARTPRGSFQNTRRKLDIKRASSPYTVSPKNKVKGKRCSQLQIGSQSSESYGPSNEGTVYEEDISRYESIAAITEDQNKNLKEQNAFLIEKLRKMKQREQKYLKMYAKAKKLKQLYQESQIEIKCLKEECETFKVQAEEMKKIALYDVEELKEKVIKIEQCEESVQNGDDEDPGSGKSYSEETKMTKYSPKGMKTFKEWQ